MKQKDEESLHHFVINISINYRFVSTGKFFKNITINGIVMSEDNTSDIACAISKPNIPKKCVVINNTGIKTNPLLKQARNKAVFALPIDWNNIFPYKVNGINHNPRH